MELHGHGDRAQDADEADQPGALLSDKSFLRSLTIQCENFDFDNTHKLTL